MYTVETTVKGISPLFQHRFPIPDLANMTKGGTKRTGAVDYSQEWKEYLYTDGKTVCQPAVHFESAMAVAAGSFKITGKGRKTYRDLFKASVFVTPDLISHGIAIPSTLDTDADKPIYLDARPAVIQRSRIVRIRPALKPGWELEFEILVNDDQINWEIVKDVLELAGRNVGIGDHRPRFGRFTVVHFEVNQ